MTSNKVLKKLVFKNKLKTYRHVPGKTRFRSYLFRTLNNSAIDYLKWLERDLLKQAVSINRMDQEPVGMPVNSQLPEVNISSERAFNAKRRRVILANTIERVKVIEAVGNPTKGKSMPYDVDILIWRKCEGLSAPKIAKKTGLTNNAVRSRARMGRLRLREAIRQYLREEGMTEEEIDDEISELLKDSHGT